MLSFSDFKCILQTISKSLENIEYICVLSNSSTYLIILTRLSHVARLTFFSLIFITKSPGNKPACSAIESFDVKEIEQKLDM